MSEGQDVQIQVIVNNTVGIRQWELAGRQPPPVGGAWAIPPENIGAHTQIAMSVKTAIVNSLNAVHVSYYSAENYILHIVFGWPPEAAGPFCMSSYQAGNGTQHSVAVTALPHNDPQLWAFEVQVPNLV